MGQDYPLHAITELGSQPAPKLEQPDPEPMKFCHRGKTTTLRAGDLVVYTENHSDLVTRMEFSRGGISLLPRNKDHFKKHVDVATSQAEFCDKCFQKFPSKGDFQRYCREISGNVTISDVMDSSHVDYTRWVILVSA